MYLDGSRRQIIAWVEQGLNDREIAERLNVSSSTVRYWRDRNGIVRPGKANDPSEQKPQTKPKSKPADK